MTVLHGKAYRKAEDAYIAARKGGKRPAEAALALNLTVTAAEAFEGFYRYQSSGGHTLDNSCPKFADHDLHLAGLRRGFPAFSERFGPRGSATVCAPLQWPGVAA